MLYSVTAKKEDDLDGWGSLSSGKEVQTSHPLNDLPGFNPEEFISLAWSSCLNATIQAILEAKGYHDTPSRVEVTVNLEKETNQSGYYFDVTALAAIKGWEIEKAEPFIKEAHNRCPVSKLIKQAKTVKLTVVEW